jgi:hypothetical protein
MGAHGYRGMFGCDFIVDESGQIYFVEVNARKQGTALESTLTMFHRLPEHPTLPEIEFCAITRGKLPQSLTEMDSTRSHICWGTYNVKSERDIRVVQKVTCCQDEAEMFRQVFQGKGITSRAIVEDHLGPGVFQRAGGFIARCISVGKSLSDMNSQLKKKEMQVRSSFRPWHH